MSAEFKGSDDFPVLLLRRQVAFPRVVVRVLVGRKRSLALLKHLQKQGKVGQKQPTFAAVTVRETEVSLRTTARARGSCRGAPRPPRAAAALPPLAASLCPRGEYPLRSAYRILATRG
jgi:hypothetical protein